MTWEWESKSVAKAALLTLGVPNVTREAVKLDASVHCPELHASKPHEQRAEFRQCSIKRVVYLRSSASVFVDDPVVVVKTKKDDTRK